MVVGARRIRSEKLREHQYREGYTRSLEGKGVEWEIIIAGEMGNGRKWKRSMWFIESREKEPKESVVEQ